MVKTETKELKKIKILSLAKIAALFGVIYGLISGIFISVLKTIITKNPVLLQTLGSQIEVVTALGYKSLIILPILNGIGYFIVGVVVAFLYNLIAKRVGGVKLELN